MGNYFDTPKSLWAQEPCLKIIGAVDPLDPWDPSAAPDCAMLFVAEHAGTAHTSIILFPKTPTMPIELAFLNLCLFSPTGTIHDVLTSCSVENMASMSPG